MKLIKYLSVAVLLLVASASIAQTTNYQVHSLFVMNIAKYSTWPVHHPEFTIAVFGKSKIFDELQKNIAGKSINGMTVRVVQIEDITEIGAAQLIFVPDSKSGSLEDVRRATENKPVLIVAEREGLFKKGAGFSFVILENNTLRYDINHGEIDKRQIKVSKNLAALANSVM